MSAEPAACTQFDLELFLENVCFSLSQQLPSSLTGLPATCQPLSGSSCLHCRRDFRNAALGGVCKLSSLQVGGGDRDE